MNKSTKKRIGAIGVVCALCLSMAASLAFFTDRAEADASATAGNIDLVWTDISSSKTGANDIQSVNEFAVDEAWNSETGLVSEGKIINPGDNFDLSYTLKNTGSKSIRVAQEIVLISDVALTADAEEYALTITGGANTEAVEPVMTAEGEGTKLTYNLANIVLGGELEPEEDQTAAYNTDVTYEVELMFSEAARNAFMDSTVSVKYNAVAIQARNTEDGDLPSDTDDLAAIVETAEGAGDAAEWEYISASTGA